MTQRKRMDVTEEEQAIIREIRAQRKAEAPEDPAPMISTIDGEPVGPIDEPETNGKASPPLDPSQVMIWTEQAQGLLDQKTVNDQLAAMRHQLAATKLNRLLAQRGVVREKHPNQFESDVRVQQKAVDALVEIRTNMDLMDRLLDED